MKISDLELSPVVQEGLAIAQRTFGLTPEQVLALALETFLEERGLLPKKLPQQRETRGRAEMAFAREPER